MKRSALLLATILSCAAWAQELKPIALPAPKTDGGMPLMRALKERATKREFSPRQLPPQVLSNLLWAAFGINRPDGRRTAPSAVNWQEIDVYVVMPEGTYVYDAKANTLQPVVAGDLRAETGGQDFVATAPLNLVYVADYSRMKNAQPESRISNSSADTGFISQNVYLFCASEGLATVVRGGVNREALTKSLRLREDQRVTLAQTVGYPK